MPLAPGTQLGPYEITAPLGAGGMGEVYRARDTKLGRDVALKVLPEGFSKDSERMARFRREAQVLASLNHPNIASIYGLEDSGGVHALVMELVEGPTLAERVQPSGVPLEEALAIARQIAEALEAAHEKGIVHRDLKPSNVKVTPEGKVKVLDFGLAKALDPLDSASNLSPNDSPTVSAAASKAGLILGTAAYMSPEQARGKPVDKRTDIWSFGCVLYETLTGGQAFASETVSDTIAKILEREPDWQRLPAETPGHIRQLLRRCLEKDPKRRLRDIGDARIEIEEARVAPAPPDGPAPIRHSRRAWKSSLLWTLAGILVGGLIATITVLKLQSGGSPGTSSPKQLALSLPSTVELVAHDKQGLAISPDGKHVVFPGRRAGVTQLYDRPIDRLEASPIPGTQGAAQPFFSPNGRWVGFFAGGKLKKVALAGGTPVAICDVRDPNGATWGSDDMILFGDKGVLRVSAAGGSPQTVTIPDSNRNESDHMEPDILPGGEAFLFTIWTGGYAHAKVAVQSLKTGQRRVLLDGIKPRFAATGHIVFFRAGSLWAAPFDLDRLDVTGEPLPVVEGIHVEWAVWPYFSFASDGTLIYAPGAPLDAKRLVWVDRKGAVQPLNAPPKPYDNPRLSPDGQRLAVVIREENHDVWTYEPARGTLTRLTSDPGEDETPVWMPDGKRLVFAGNRSGGSQLLSTGADGSGTEEVLLGIRRGHRHADSLSPDGQVLAFEEESQATGSDIWVMPLQGDRKARPFLRTTFNEAGAKFSPDGRWIAYSSDESGRSEVYVQAYPGPGGKRQISTEGGVEPVWARSGRELFYRNGVKLLVAEVRTQPAFSASRPRVLFEGRYDTLPWNSNYDVTPDGQRFLMVQSAEPTGQSQINVVLNWFEELKRLAAEGKQ